jgi:aminoglycoside 6'-N-acetyltransferase
MPRIELQAFEPERDLPLIATWLDRPHVARWWGESGKALSELRTHAAEAVALITLDGRPVGLLCWQTPSPEELKQAGLADLPSDLIDVDIMIGEPGAQGRGVGPEALRLLFEKLSARGAVLVGLATALANQRAISACAKAGLRPFRDFVEVGEPYRYFTRRLSDVG